MLNIFKLHSFYFISNSKTFSTKPIDKFLVHKLLHKNSFFYHLFKRAFQNIGSGSNYFFKLSLFFVHSFLFIKDKDNKRFMVKKIKRKDCFFLFYFLSFNTSSYKLIFK